MRRRKWGVVGICLAIVGCLIWANLKRTEFVVLESPITVQLLAIEDIGRKPRIDIQLPPFGRVTYPRNWSHLPLAVGSDTGMLNPKTSAGIIFDPKHTFIVVPGPCETTWDIGGEHHQSPDRAWNNEYSNCPTMFGSRPQIATVTTDVFDKKSPITLKVQLPPCGITQPLLPVYEGKLGDWAVSLEPIPWVAPMFPIRYRVTVRDVKGSVFHVRGNWAYFGKGRGFGFSVRCTPERAGVLNLEAIDVSFSVPETDRVLDLYVKRLTGTAAPFHVTCYAGLSGKRRVKVTGDDSRVYADAAPSGALTEAVPNPAGVADVRLGTIWPIDTACHENSGRLVIEEFEKMTAFKDGETVNGVIYSPAEERHLRLTLPIPAPRPYRPLHSIAY